MSERPDTSYEKPEYKRMYQVLRKALGLNAGRSLLTIFLFNILMSFLLTAGVSPTLINENNIFLSILSVLLTFIILIVIFTLVYGIILGFTNYILGRPQIPLSIFRGFADKSKRVFLSSLLFSVLAVIVFCVSCAVTFAFRNFITGTLATLFTIPSTQIPMIFTDEQITEVARILAAATFCMLVFFFIFSLVAVPFVFIWVTYAYDKTTGFKDALKKSLFVIHGRYFHYIGFVIYACVMNAVILLIVLLLDALISGFNTAFLSFFFGILAFVEYYTILSKVYYCICIYYFSFLSVNNLTNESSKHEDDFRQVIEKQQDENPS